MGQFTFLIMEEFLCGTDYNVGDLKTGKVINGLTERNRAYATYLSLAASAGALVLMDQVHPQCRKIHEFAKEFMKKIGIDTLRQYSANSGTKEFYLMEYFAQFYYNYGNYMGFGDTKFIPRCSQQELREIINGDANLTNLLDACIDDIYSLDEKSLRIGFGPENSTAYYFPQDFSKDEVTAIDDILTKAGIKNHNTTITRAEDKYVVAIHSIEIDQQGQKIGEYNGKPVIYTKGLHSEELKHVCKWLTKAIDVCENDTQKEMLKSLIEHYTHGRVEDHIKYSEHWVRDIDPKVETYQGFIESYRDPQGVRCEYEGFIACVDTEESEVLHNFVDNSKTILKLLPYPEEYERKTFNPPSYNALSILTFVTTGLPIGINIPNYDEIRQNIGFKNVSLVNVMAGSSSDKKSYPFLTEEELNIVLANSNEALTANVAIHELYGHGSAALLHKEDVVGKNVPDLLTPGKFVESYYPDDQGYDYMFGPSGSAFEECRAETTSVYLGFYNEVLDIFNVPQDNRHNFTYALTLMMLNSGIKSLQFYSAESCQWKQAHSRARFAILRACIIWGRGSVIVKKVDDEQCNYRLIVDPNRLDDVKDAITMLLKHLNYYRSTCQPGPGKEFFSGLTSLDDFWLSVRETAIKQKVPRSVYAMANITKNGDKYDLQQLYSDKPTTADVSYTLMTNIVTALEE